MNDSPSVYMTITACAARCEKKVNFILEHFFRYKDNLGIKF